jgi:hypothetical protein
MHTISVRHALSHSLVALVTCLALLLVVASMAVAAPSPTATTGRATGVTYSSATVHGSVNPEGQQTNYVFQYGTSRSYGAQTPLSVAGSGTGSVSVSQTIAGLQPLTTYHYRILASGPDGSATGSDRTFTTPKIPLSVAIVGIPNPVAFGSTFDVDGTLSGSEAANHAVQLESNPFPYTAGFKVVGNPELTNAAGGFSFPYLGLLENAQIRVSTVGTPLVSSGVVLEGVAVVVTLHAHSTKRRGYARLYGTVTPAEVGALVGFQLLKPGHNSINASGTVVRAGTSTVSSFSRVVRVKPGVYQALVKVDDGSHMSAYSTPVLIR